MSSRPEVPARPTALARARARLRGARRGREIAAALHRRVPVPWVTWFLVGLELLMGLVSMGLADVPLRADPRGLLTWGALYAPYVLDGQTWRVPMSMFLHVDVSHLLGNVLLLLLAGSTAERLFGPLTFGAIFVASGLVGAVGTMVVHPGLIQVGASAAVLGTLAAVLGYLLRRPVARENVRFLGALWTFGLVFLVYTGLSAALGLFGAFVNVGHVAHAAGTAFGLVAGLVAARPATDDREGPRRRAALPVVVLGALLVVGGMRLVPRVDDALDVILDVRELEQTLTTHRPGSRWQAPSPEGRPRWLGAPPLRPLARDRSLLPAYRALAQRADALDRVDPQLEIPVAELRTYLHGRVEALEHPGRETPGGR